jgi:hypothetical protein
MTDLRSTAAGSSVLIQDNTTAPIRSTQVGFSVAYLNDTDAAIRVTQVGVIAVMDIAIYPATGRRFFVVAT